MKKITSLKPPRPSGTPPFQRRGIYPVLTVFFLSSFSLLLSPLAAQTNDSLILDSVSIQKNELIVTPELEEMVVMHIKNLPEEAYFDYGIKDKAQLENLHIGKPIPWYMIENEESQTLYTFNASRVADGKSLSLRFANTWNVPVMSEEEPLLFALIRFTDFGDPYISSGNKNTIEHFHTYEHKDSIIGSVGVNPSNRGMDFLIIRKDNKDIFVEVYDETTKDYFKNEYNFNDVINHIKDLGLREKEARMRYYAQIADKTELEITPEIAEIVVSTTYSLYKDVNEERFSDHGIKHRPQLENLHLGKPIPMYYILEDDNLTFVGRWQIPVMSGDEPFCFTRIKLEGDGQYSWAGTGGISADVIHNYEHKDLIIGFLDAGRGRYLIIRREDKDIFVQIYNYGTPEYLKNEYSFGEILNHLKK